MDLRGYIFTREGHYDRPILLKEKDQLVQFIKDNLNAAKLVITDQADQQILLIQDGVDLYNDLEQFGISLSEIFRAVRAEQVGDMDEARQKQAWEKLYDSIGLSPGEIRMRQRVKRDCLAAQTVQDVADLVSGTYFTVFFISPDDDQCWGYFDETDFSAAVMEKDTDGYWSDTGRMVRIPRDGRVKHLRSGEDIHDFLLFDLPTQAID